MATNKKQNIKVENNSRRRSLINKALLDVQKYFTYCVAGIGTLVLAGRLTLSAYNMGLQNFTKASKVGDLMYERKKYGKGSELVFDKEDIKYTFGYKTNKWDTYSRELICKISENKHELTIKDKNADGLNYIDIGDGIVIYPSPRDKVVVNNLEEHFLFDLSKEKRGKINDEYSNALNLALQHLPAEVARLKKEKDAKVAEEIRIASERKKRNLSLINRGLENFFAK